MTYLLLNLPFVAVALVLLAVAVVRSRRSPEAPARRLRSLAVALLGVLILTAVFDNVIVALGIVAYDPAHFSGVRIGLAPIEDFAYAVVAGIGLPALWLLLPARNREPR
jgi:lycopene cyclase domain-containing protein